MEKGKEKESRLMEGGKAFAREGKDQRAGANHHETVVSREERCHGKEKAKPLSLDMDPRQM